MPIVHGNQNEENSLWSQYINQFLYRLKFCGYLFLFAKNLFQQNGWSFHFIQIVDWKNTIISFYFMTLLKNHQRCTKMGVIVHSFIKSNNFLSSSCYERRIELSNILLFIYTYSIYYFSTKN